ncbi:type IV pilus twitching motility protein PilT [Sulfoacidibacillus ferrooxidans]|uniref:Twitching mobility protein n=1 Tax=Sulfoacidibacillus ferrooxidans TaxID=2005001 RepID=A0A9X1V9V4_9BACL|nr:Twitching mobility protein [Sulfoacidibacillus ferrooxidans]
MSRIIELLEAAVKNEASDLHVTVGSPPVFRITGDLRISKEMAFSAQDTEAMLRELLSSDQWTQLLLHGEIDFSYSLPGVSRFRMNAYRQRGCYSLAVRMVPTIIPAFDRLGLPSMVRTFADRQQGLVLVTGPTGSGKTTTLAALINYINQTQQRHIITLEDPIEYLHRHGHSVIDQREVGVDTMSFAKGLRAALRQDPDVLLVGEMRDLETIATAITAAETGHLVFATLHTSDAPQSIDRMIDVFPPQQQQQIRIQLASVLQGIVSQRLIPTADGSSRVAAVEILVNTPAIANLIRSEKIHQIKTMLQTGKMHGMQTMEMSLRDLVQSKHITETQVRQLASEWVGGLTVL